MKVYICGKQRCSGTSKRTGQAYDFAVIHYTCRDRSVIGEAAKTVTIDPNLFPFDSIAVPGEYVLDFDERGHLMDLTPVNTK